MLNPQDTTPAHSPVHALAVIYTVTLKGQAPAEVRAERRGLLMYYSCTCRAFTLWHECEHTRAVAETRQAEGRAH